jgi:hypothetical protein
VKAQVVVPCVGLLFKRKSPLPTTGPRRVKKFDRFEKTRLVEDETVSLPSEKLPSGIPW